jgi:hypothetical protein
MKNIKNTVQNEIHKRFKISVEFNDGSGNGYDLNIYKPYPPCEPIYRNTQYCIISLGNEKVSTSLDIANVVFIVKNTVTSNKEHAIIRSYLQTLGEMVYD